MSDSKSIYLISQNYGYVLAYQENGKPSPLIVGYAGDRGDAEKWIVEQGDEPNTVALKSALNGQYLTGEKTDRGKVSLREEKQWWIIDHDNKDIHSPGAYRLRLAESPKYWLFVSSSGSIRQGQQGWQVVMFLWYSHCAPQTTWYFSNDDGSSGLSGLGASEDRAAEKKQLEDREAALANKEKETAEAKKATKDREAVSAQQGKDSAAASKDLEAREAELAKKGEDRASGKKALEEREAAISKSEKDSSKALEEREAAVSKKEKESNKAIEEREAALAEKEKDSNTASGDRETARSKQEKDSNKALQDREAALSKREKENTKALEDRESALIQKEKTQAADQKALRDREAALAQKADDHFANQKALKKREAALAQKEENQATEWEKKNKELQTLQQSFTQQKKSPAANALPPGCGYKHYKPPRKLNRKVIGLVYEQ